MADLRQTAGNLFDQFVSSRLYSSYLPEFGISEAIAGNKPTTYTGVTQQSQAGGFTPYTPATMSNRSTGLSYPNQSVLGASTQNRSAATQSQGGATGGGGGGGFPAPTPSGDGGSGGQPSAPSYEDIMRGNIESGYGDYFRGLDEMMGTLPGQAEAQRGIVQNQYQQGFNTLTGQRDVSNQLLGSQRTKAEASQKKNLFDMQENIRNLFQSGQNRLGAMGAGDSSAANMYSYALTKMGNKQRGDITAQTAGIMGDIADREFQVNNTFNTESNNLALERDSKMNEIATWLSDAQNQIRQMKATGQLQKGQDLASLSNQLLNNAMNMANQARAEFANKQSMLEQWAMQRSTDINTLKQNMAGVSDIQYSLPAFQGMNANMGGYAGQQQRQPVYGGGLFGNQEDNRYRV